jgi:hypothetical protein
MGRLYTCYAPVRRSSACIATPVTPRLACIRPAASVHPEPGSNSPLYKSLNSLTKILNLNRNYLIIVFDDNPSIKGRYFVSQRKYLIHVVNIVSTTYLPATFWQSFPSMNVYIYLVGSLLKSQLAVF